MERALDPNMIQAALGVPHGGLPTPAELIDTLATAEVSLLQGEPTGSEELLRTAWYLHGVASSAEAVRMYGAQRQRAAYQVSAHAFDVCLRTGDTDWLDRAQLVFAAQVAYQRSELNPNSIAIYRRELADQLATGPFLEQPAAVALSCGAALLSFDIEYLSSTRDAFHREIDTLRDIIHVRRIDLSMFGSAASVVLGVHNVARFLVRGSDEDLERGLDQFARALGSMQAEADRPSRWVAAHLLNLTDDLRASSIWKALPPEVSSPVRTGFALAPPRVVTLWPPQVQLAQQVTGGEASIFSSEARRVFISAPTSAGKTLFAQLLIASHLDASSEGVCYVAPTRSLCNEVRRNLDRRLRVIRPGHVEWLPDRLAASESLGGDAAVEVMTPERLSFLLRMNAKGVLDRFGMFVFDEAHSVGDGERGWTLETDLAFLHHKTRPSHHRIVLMSAAIGNRLHFINWLGGSDEVVVDHSDWRGPRRFHCIYTTERDRASRVREQRPRSKAWPIRERYDLYGVLHARPAHGDVKSLRTTESVGQLALLRAPTGKLKRESPQPTPFYKQLIPVIQHLASGGPILVIQGTKELALKTAQAIAKQQSEEFAPDIRLRPLMELIDVRLGHDHPLASVVERGVTYYHGSLPHEIRSRIEEAVSEGLLPFTVATTAMTEGINLPVRAVVLAATGFFGRDGWTETISGARLLNAIGRAGRAAKETDGIVVLALNKRVSSGDFDRLTPSAEELAARSWLTSKEALDQLAQHEAAVIRGADELIETASEVIRDFTEFIWFIAAELEQLNRALTIKEVDLWLQDTLAWLQLQEAERLRWRRVSEQVLAKYAETNSDARRRWATSGTSISTARVLDELSDEIVSEVLEANRRILPAEFLRLLLAEDRLERLFALGEAPDRSIWTQRRGRRTEIHLSIPALMTDWVAGHDLRSLAAKYFSAVTDTDYRFEQLGDVLYQCFEIYLPWVTSILLDWVNARLEDDFPERVFPLYLPALLRWGVPTEEATLLMNRGLSSRRLAVQIVEEWERDNADIDLISWLRLTPVSTWTNRFRAREAELLDLLEVIRAQRRSLVSDFLADRNADAELILRTDPPAEAHAVQMIDPGGDQAVSAIEVVVDEKVVGEVAPHMHTDVLQILRLGEDFTAEWRSVADQSTLRLCRRVRPGTGA